MEADKEKEVLETMNNLKNQIPEINNRAEKRKKKKYYSDLLKKHMLTVPKKTVTPDSTEEEALEFSGKVRNWTIRKAILDRKLQELG
jgi:DNA-directed RNA polymerase subunit H (RpoH/RPB5)